MKQVLTIDPRVNIQYNTLKLAIPKHIRVSLLRAYNAEQLKKAFDLRQNTNWSNIELNKIVEKKSKEIRNIISFQENIRICGKEFWKRKFNIDITNHYILAQLATKESRLRILHFKLLHNIYPTNITLTKMGLRENDKCETCNQRDYIEHMFVHCNELQNFWEFVSSHIKKYTGHEIRLTTTDILFGIEYNTLNKTREEVNIINHILLIGKMCISKFRYGKKMSLKLIFELEIELRIRYLKTLNM